MSMVDMTKPGFYKFLAKLLDLYNARVKAGMLEIEKNEVYAQARLDAASKTGFELD